MFLQMFLCIDLLFFVEQSERLTITSLNLLTRQDLFGVDEVSCPSQLIIYLLSKIKGTDQALLIWNSCKNQKSNQLQIFHLNKMIEKAVSRIEWCSEQIQIDPLNKSFIIQRSDAFAVEGKYDQAISDCSKLIILEPSRQYYMKRSKLLQDRGMFSLALQDLKEAKDLQKQNVDETAADIYLQNSLCMTNLKQASEMAKIIQENKENNDVSQYSKTLQKLLHVHQIKIEQAKQEEIQKLKLYYEEQTKGLKELFMNQLNQLKLKIQCTVQNYQEKFLLRLNKQKLFPNEAQKMKLYFQTFSSQMQKYYIAAKNLHKIEDKSIKFQDFQTILTHQNRNDFLKKIYKFFDKYSSQIQKIISVIHNIPYIGTAFEVIKKAINVKEWAQEANIQAQCKNIQRVSINTTSFNQFATNLAYYITFHFQKDILSQHPKYKSEWEQLVLKIKELKRQHLGIAQYKHHTAQQMEAIKDYATIHASTIMVAFACNCIVFNKQHLKQLNQQDESGQKEPQNQKMGEIYKIISQVERQLKKPYKQTSTTKEEVAKSEKKYCEIY